MRMFHDKRKNIFNTMFRDQIQWYDNKTKELDQGFNPMFSWVHMQMWSYNFKNSWSVKKPRIKNEKKVNDWLTLVDNSTLTFTT